MTRNEKTKRFLLGASLLIVGILALIGGSGTFLPYIFGGGLIAFGLLMMTDSGSKLPAYLTILLGGLFLAKALLSWPILTILGVTSLIAGGAISFSTYKKLNRY